MCFAIYELNAFDLYPCMNEYQKINHSANTSIFTACDVAGEVVTVGGVKKLKAGDKVVATLNFISIIYDASLRAISCHIAIHFAASSEKLTAARPQEVSAAEGAGLTSSSLTAHQALTQAAGIKLDGTGQLKNILITGASGGIGHYAVQLAKLGNTHVTATCGARNVDIVKSLGAGEVLDYKTPDGAALKSPSGRKYDFPNLSANGKVIDLTFGVSALITCTLQRLNFSKKQLVPMIINPKRENLDYLVELMKEGKLKTVIDSKHHLSKAEDAWARELMAMLMGRSLWRFNHAKYLGIL
ncbi:quinone-oxidoreductase-like protein [Pyrus ussuriensis x Pyrus communis]|uniref:Quinone-oxidoreductase-like protein n=1 Tax=Pyrus ussuriensis x Pyrus communis TaxID=2448454 RepID=A0A5N5GK85_9ROSA|nr:quinone-oxidoreductase-like protein [Pyrus ussuriensis x Pyrus communis]